MRRVVTGVSLVGLLMLTPAVSAHQTKTAGSLTISAGWGREPAYAGLENSVELEATGPSGMPVTDPAASLSVQVSFGDNAVTLPMRPVLEPGKFTAAIIPTRAGTYAIHMTGTLMGEQIDLASTCSEQTFDCVIDASEIQFPVPDPLGADLATRLSREASRVREAQREAASARGFAIAALALAVVALAAKGGHRRGKPGKDV